MRATVAMFVMLLASMAGGCAEWVRPSELRPPGHILLAGLTPRSPPPPSWPAARDRAAGDNAAARARALIGSTHVGRRPIDDRALLAAAYPTPATLTEAGLARWPTVHAAAARPGDVLRLRTDGGAPALAIVVGRAPTGALSAVAITRGAAREIRVDVERPTQRRAPDGVVNSFLRKVQPDDAPGTVYLAGGLVRDARRP